MCVWVELSSPSAIQQVKSDVKQVVGVHLLHSEESFEELANCDVGCSGARNLLQSIEHQTHQARIVLHKKKKTKFVVPLLYP